MTSRTAHGDFSFSRALTALVNRSGSPEREASADIARAHSDFLAQMPTVGKPMGEGFWLSLDGLGQRANVDSVTATTGGAFKFTQAGAFIETLRNKTVTLRAGATVLTGLSGPVSYPVQNGTSSAAWGPENPGADVARSNFTTASSVTLAVKTVQAATAISRQTLFSSAGGNFDMEQVVRNDLAKVIAVAIDLGVLNGLGSSNQPLGLLQNTAVSTYAFGTNGATMTGLDAAAIEFNIAANNADDRPLTWVTTPSVRKKTRVTQAFSGAGDPVWQRDNTIHGYPAFSTQQVPSNYTKGTTTTACSGLIFGAWEDLAVAFFGPGVFIQVDPYSLKLQNLIDITCTAFVDVAVKRAASFQVAKDVVTT